MPQVDSITIPVGPRLGNVVVEAEQVSKAFDGRVLLDGASFTIPPGAVVVSGRGGRSLRGLLRTAALLCLGLLYLVVGYLPHCPHQRPAQGAMSRTRPARRSARPNLASQTNMCYDDGSRRILALPCPPSSPHNLPLLSL